MRKRKYILWSTIALLAVSTAAIGQDPLRNVRQIIAGSGLQGGGSGPTVNLSVASGAITSDHIQDSSIALDDISSAAQAALRAPTLVQNSASGSVVKDGDATLTYTTDFTLTDASHVRVSTSGYLINQIYEKAVVQGSVGIIRLSNGSPVGSAMEMVTLDVGEYGSANPTMSVQLPAGDYRLYTQISRMQGNTDITITSFTSVEIH